MSPTPWKHERNGPPRQIRARLEAHAFALSNCCPVERTNPEECPLFRLRPLSVQERRAWIRELTTDELQYLATYHRCCQADKLAGTGRGPTAVGSSTPAPGAGTAGHEAGALARRPR